MNTHTSLLFGLTVMRRKRQMTQAELADKVGTTQPIICKYERLRMAAFPHTIKKLAKALKCRASALK